MRSIRERSRTIHWLLACGLALLGCGDDGSSYPDLVIIPIQVTTNPISFEWSGGDVHVLQVAACAENCSGASCRDGFPSGSSVGLWDLGRPEVGIATVASPVEYGVSLGTPDPNAKPLMAGVDHTVGIRRVTECDPPETGCTFTEAAGCAVFTPE